MATNADIKLSPPPLPTSVEEFRSYRKVDLRRTLNDMVEEIHLDLYDTEEYPKLLYAVYDEQAVEGSLSADNILAAQAIRERAKKLGRDEITREKLATIAKALGVVLRRYGFSRKERRNMIHGEVIPNDNNE